LPSDSGVKVEVENVKVYRQTDRRATGDQNSSLELLQQIGIKITKTNIKNKTN
jgi:hypothetical protein